MSRKEKYLKELDKLKKVIVKNYKPEKIILFGSLAWGKFGPDSDADLFIIKNTKKRFGERMDEVEIMAGRARVRIPTDIIVLTPKEVSRRLYLEDFFVQDIITKGKVLYAKR